jgi:flagellar hook assembly protein FlgD
LLEQNYPNPFGESHSLRSNPQTSIRYRLNKDADISLTIYNVSGQKIRTLTRERKTAGEFMVSWDGTDDAGQPVNSGVYYYRIQSENFQQTRQMLFVR